MSTAQVWVPLLRAHVAQKWAPVLGSEFEHVLLEASEAIQGVAEAPERCCVLCVCVCVFYLVYLVNRSFLRLLHRRTRKKFFF